MWHKNYDQGNCRKYISKEFFGQTVVRRRDFMRMKKGYGTSVAQTLLCEKPLNRWVHMDGSKLSFKDSFKIMGQIGQIAVHYR